MAYNDYEESKRRGQPVELYQFVYGTEPDAFYAHTDGERTVVHDGITYTPLAIERSEFKTTGNLDRNEVQIKVPRNSALGEMFSIYPPAQIVTVRIRQGHVANADDTGSFLTGENFPVAWLGRVLEVNRKDAESILTCEAASASMRRPGLRRHYQWPCPLALYGTRCQANKAAATVAATVTAVTGNRVTLGSGFPASGRTAADYVGGLIEWAGSGGTEYQSILRIQSSATLVLSGPARDLIVGATVQVSLGCPHTLAGCESLHGNAVNYGGQPWIPTYNPLLKNNHT